MRARIVLVIRTLLRGLPAEAAAAIALACLVVSFVTLAALVPRPRPPEGGAQAGVALASSATPTALPTRSPSPTATAEPRHTGYPSPSSEPVALGTVPEAGGIVFAGAGRLGGSGIWRYDGASGTVTPIGATGHVSADGRGYVVRAGAYRGVNGPFRYVDAATGAEVQLSPDGATDADAVPAGAKGLTGVFVRDGALFAFGRDGVAAPLTDVGHALDGSEVGQVRADPTGARLAVVATRGDQNVLLVRDTATGRVRSLVEAPANVNALGARSSWMVLGSWSPDGRYLAVFGVSVSNSLNADGVDLLVLDAQSGARADLGRVLFGTGRLSWAAPHRLAYVVAQDGRFTWQGQSLRIWSPEDGVTAVTGVDDVGLNPSWSADGHTLWYIGARAAGYEPLAFFAGRESGDRRIATYDLASSERTVRAPFGTYVAEGARPSDDGAYVLVLRRTTQLAPSLAELPPIPLELVLFDTATWHGRPLVRLASDVGFGYYGAYGGPEGMAWAR